MKRHKRGAMFERTGINHLAIEPSTCKLVLDVPIASIKEEIEQLRGNITSIGAVNLLKG